MFCLMLMKITIIASLSPKNITRNIITYVFIRNDETANPNTRNIPSKTIITVIVQHSPRSTDNNSAALGSRPIF